MLGGQATMRLLAASGGCVLPSASMSRRLTSRMMNTISLSSKQEMKGFTVKDQRPTRPRVAREKRKDYLAQRKAAFEAVQNEAMNLGLQWGIKSALVLERLPVIMEDFVDWQRDFWTLQAYQAQYGAKFPSEMGFKYDDEEPLSMEKMMEQIMEESPIPLASRRTEADESDDRTTLNRALHERLVLLVKPQAESAWRLPESAWEAGETIRQAAERTARRVLVKTATEKGQPDDVSQLHFVGNCPAGWFWRKAAEDQRGPTGNFGDKVFMNRVQLICGEPNLVSSEAAEHVWVTKHEIGDYLGEEMAVYMRHMI